MNSDKRHLRGNTAPATRLPSGDTAGWTLLSNHTHVLVCLARNPDQVPREVVQQVGNTERAVTAAHEV